MNTTRLMLCSALLIICASAMADLKSDAQKQLDLYCAAVLKKDVVSIEKILRATYAPDFKGIPKKGPVITLAKWIEDEKMMATMTEKVTKMSIHIDSLKAGTGTATLQLSMVYEGVAKIDPKGKAGLLKVVAKSEEKMVKKGGKWWISEFREEKSTNTFNGKPLAM